MCSFLLLLLLLACSFFTHPAGVCTSTRPARRRRGAARGRELAAASVAADVRAVAWCFWWGCVKRGRKEGAFLGK